MEINGINQIVNTPEPKKSKKAEKKPAIEQKNVRASAQDAAGSYGKAMINMPKISFGQAQHQGNNPEPQGSVTTGENGNCYVDGQDTGVKASEEQPATEKNIPSSYVDPESGHVIIDYPDGSSKDIGIPKPFGRYGIKIASTSIDPKSGHLLVEYSDGAIEDKGQVPGYFPSKSIDDGEQDTGVKASEEQPATEKNIPSSYVDPESGHVIIDYPDGSSKDIGIPKPFGRYVTKIASTSIDPKSGHLLVEYSDGAIEDKGQVPGYFPSKSIDDGEQDTVAPASEEQPATEKNIPSSYVDPESGHVIIDYPDGSSKDIGIPKPNGRYGIKIASTSIDPKSGHLLVEYSDGTIEDNGEVPGYFPSKSIDDGEQDTVAPAPEEQPDTEVRIVSSFIDPKSGYIIQKFNDGTLVNTGVYPEENTETTPSLSETVPEPSETIDREAIKASVKAKIEELPRKIKAHLQGVEITDANAPTADKILSDEKLLNNKRFMTHAKEIISAVKTPEQEKVVDVMLQQESVLDNKTFMSHAADLIAICGDIFDESEIEVSIKNNAFADNKRGLEVISAYQKGKSAIEHTSDMYNPKTTKKEIKEMVQEKIAYLPEKVAEKLKRVRITDENVFFIDTISSDKNIMKNRLFMNNLPRIADNITNKDQASLAMLIAYDENLNSNITFVEHAADVISVGQELLGNRAMVTALMYDGVVNNKNLLQTFSRMNKVKNSDPVEYSLGERSYKFELSGCIRNLMTK